jgi:hypothetical protein
MGFSDFFIASRAPRTVRNRRKVVSLLGYRRAFRLFEIRFNEFAIVFLRVVIFENHGISFPACRGTFFSAGPDELLTRQT